MQPPSPNLSRSQSTTPVSSSMRLSPSTPPIPPRMAPSTCMTSSYFFTSSPTSGLFPGCTRTRLRSPMSGLLPRPSTAICRPSRRFSLYEVTVVGLCLHKQTKKPISCHTFRSKWGIYSPFWQILLKGRVMNLWYSFETSSSIFC